MKRKKLVKIINIILIIAFVVGAFHVGRIYYDYNKADDLYENIQDQYVASNEELFTPNESNAPSTLPEPPISIDFEALLNRNGDVKGWIYCQDTIINYPVVQANDNETYLKKDLDGKYLISGTLFADYRNGSLGQDGNYIIYGHNMKNGTMFNSLLKYKNQSYFDAHPVLYYLTPSANYRIELFAGLVLSRNDKIYLPNVDKSEFFKLVSEYRAKSTFESNVEIEYSDTFVTLSTCSYEFDNARYVLIGKLIPV